jgi:hypothetical protein
MDYLTWILQWLAFAVLVAVLVILIVVLARNPIQDTEDANLIKLNNKINWLYALEIASVGAMVLLTIVGALMYRRIPLTVC